MSKRRRIIHSDKIIQNVAAVFCLLMFLQLRGFYTLASNPVLLYATTSDIRVAELSKPGKAVPIIRGLEQGSAVDFLYRKKLVCWSDQTSELISCVNYNGSVVGDKMRIVTDGLITPTSIAIDWYTDKIYWTDGETNRIEVISIETKYRKVLFWSEVDLARAIAVVPEDGLLFWTDLGEIPKIERAGMDGDPSSRKIIVSDDIYWPNCVTVDYKNKLLYWLDLKLQFVDVIDYNGGNRKRILKGDLAYPLALALYSDKLFWINVETGVVHTWDILNNGPMRELTKADPVPVDMRIYDASRQETPADYPCKNNNGGCSHLCLLSQNPPGYNCSCPTGVKLKDGSNTTCHSGPQSLLLVAQRSSISKISLDSPDFTPYTIPLKDVKRALSVDFDQKTEHIYWADNMSKSISRSRLDGTEQAVIINQGIGEPDSIAVDSIARNIYWTDPIDDTISVARLDGSCRKVVIHEQLYDPRAIALHPTAGLMFWSDWNEKRPKIERAYLDGSSRVMIVSEKVAWPNGIAIDTAKNKLYWGDARTHKIEVCNLDGTERKEIHNTDIVHIFGLTLLGDQLYWTDMQRRTLDRINKTTGLERQAVVEQMANMMGVKALHLGDKPGWNPCADGNGGCSHLCFNRPTEFVCSCPLGLELRSDRKTCTEPESFLVYSKKNIIGRISIENENNDAVLPLKELKEVSALSVHVSGSKIYWSDSKTKTINRCTVNGSNMEKILEWTGLVEGIAIDWSAQNIYWVDSSLQRIEVSRLDGSSRRTILWQGLKKPKSIALDPKKGYMYWSELGSKVIKHAAMDGSYPSVLIEQVGKVNALAIDYDKRTIYWAALEPSAIEFAHLDGSSRKKILSEDIPMPYALTLYNDKVFWGDWTSGNIEVANKADGLNRQKIHKKLDFLSDLKVYHRSRNAGGNQCSVDNGGCSSLCLAYPAKDGRADYKCACPTHHTLNKDNLTCSEPDDFLLYATKNTIGRIVIASGECSDAIVPVAGLKNVRAIEYDPEKKHIYWTDDDNHSIRRISISYTTKSVSEAVTVTTTGSCRPFHIAFDVLGRALYWTCIDGDSINASTVDSNFSVEVIAKGDGLMPRHLTINAVQRFLIWNDVGLGSIVRASIDGTDRKELAHANNATALAVDQGTDTVFWAVNKQIHAIQLDGSNKRTIFQGAASLALAVYGGSLWSSSSGGISRVYPKREPPTVTVRHVALVNTRPASESHPCYKNGGCSGLGTCLPQGLCGCGTRCPAQCSPGQLACAGQCVPLAWRCDGQLDCEDGADESPSECGSCGAALRCADGACAESLEACAAGAWCPAPVPDAFRCDDRLCLSSRLLCDGLRHCVDGEDESPASCGTRSNTTGAETNGNAYLACGITLGLACVIGLSLHVLRKYRASKRHRQPPPMLMSPRKPVSVTATASLYSPAETSDSGSGRYPRPTLNPPPSPAGSSGAGGGGGGGGAGVPGGGGGGGGGGVGAERRRRAGRPRVPPPTPASTDAADSDYRAPPPSPLTPY